MKRTRRSTPVDALLGDAREVAREVDAYARDAKIFSSEREHLIARYENQWVAAYDGDVRAAARDLTALLREVDRLGIPRDRAVVRFIARDERTMIL